jgi:molecular chaperone DnaK
VPQIEVTFDIDANGIVHVSAKDLGTGKEQKIRIESSSGLGEDEIRRMVREAEQNAAADRKEKETAEAKNAADGLLYTAEKALRDLGAKVGETDRKAVESAAAELRASLAADDAGLIRSKTEELQKAAYRLSEELYKDAGSRAQATGGSERGSARSKPAPEAAEDVDYEIVDDGKKKK